MNVKFVTARGSNRLTSKSYYIGIPKHERTMSKKETYALCADRTGYKPTAVKAVFLALREYLRENAARGNITYVDGISSVRNYVRGAFEGLGGPWVKGADGKRPTVETRRLRTATSFGIMMKRVMLKQTQTYKLGVNIMFGAGNQYYNRHYEQ